MIRFLEPGDEVLLDTFLAKHADTSMFLRSNLSSHGLAPGDHPHSTRYAAYFENAQIVGVLARTNGGSVLVQAPRGVGALAFEFAGQTVASMTGDATQVRDALADLGLDQAEYTLRHDEPLCALDLAGMRPVSAQLRNPAIVDLPLLEDWFENYVFETGLEATRSAARTAAISRAESALENDELWIMSLDTQPVAMAALNAQAAGMVQVGGVYVPDHLRGQRLGGRIVQAMLTQARDRGAERAILFANNEAAERAYARIGFERVGTYRVAVLKSPQPVRPGAPRPAVAAL